MGLCWYLQLLTNPLDQGLSSANVTDSQMSAAWKLLTWKDLGAPLTVRKFLFQWEGLSRKKCTSVSAMEKKTSRCRSSHSHHCSCARKFKHCVMND